MVTWMVWRRAEPGHGDRLLGGFVAEAEAKAAAGRDAAAHGTGLGGWGSLPWADAPAEARGAARWSPPTRSTGAGGTCSAADPRAGLPLATGHYSAILGHL